MAVPIIYNLRSVKARWTSAIVAVLGIAGTVGVFVAMLSLARGFKGVRVAWWKGLGGIPFEAETRDIINSRRSVFESLGCIVEDAEPDFAGIDEAFPTLRHL